MKPSSWVVPYMALLLLVGTGYLAILPPFEGFDEFAYYSSLRQVADTATIPVYGASFLDDAVVRYRGPMPYDSGTPPFHPLLGAKSYLEFFKSPSDVTSYASEYGQNGFRARFHESPIPNWAAQHPPLYYVLLAPVVWATDHASFLGQLFFLRLASYLLAIGGVMLGLAAIRNSERLRSPAALGFVYYPLLLPQFFPEFARIGNDSLCLFLLGWLMYLMVDQEDATERRWKPWLIGLVLGLGLLTKAFFLPITLAVVLWVVLRRLRSRHDASGARKMWPPEVAAILITSAVVGGWWYIDKFLAYGEISGGAEAIGLAQTGGLLNGLIKHSSFLAIVRGWAVIVVTWIWTGTWSLARLPVYLQLPLVVFTLWTVSEFVVQMRGRSLQDINWLTVLMTLGIGVGLMHHTIQRVAIGGNANSGGWYLHILMPWTALALGFGISAILQRTFARRLFIFLTGYAVLFHSIAIWSEIALFSGCATKGPDKLYHFSTPLYCLDQLPLVADRLGIFAWPGIAVCSFSGAVVCALWLGTVSRRNGLFSGLNPDGLA